MKIKSRNMEEILADSNISEYEDLPSPKKLIEEIPVSKYARETVLKTRESIKNILDGKDNRKIILLGPCSIHEVKSALEYADKIVKLQEEVKDELLLVMRTYLEKPRSTIGWKGIIYDPYLDESCDIEAGLKISRKLLLDISNKGVGCANEFLREDFPQYVADLISWGAIGARTVESQNHRELASGLSMPIGFKNNTAGDISAAVDAVLTARHAHTFVGLTIDGKDCKVKTKGNQYSHIVLRGGNGQPNYHPEKVQESIELLRKAKVPTNIIVDCSHANSNKQYEKQEQVAYDVLNQINSGTKEIVGIMLESNLYEGKQNFPKNKEEIKNLKYGVSITDSCVNFDTTQRIVLKYAEILKRIKLH